MDIAQRLPAALPGAYGPMCYQAVVDEAGRAAVFEINARFGGGYPLAHAAGARFTQWLIEDALDLPSSASSEWTDGLMMLRYDAAVFCRRDW
jgi:carbamoyl-phosphate synthase large subunit